MIDPPAKRGKTTAHLIHPEDVHAVVRALGRSPTGVRNAALLTVLWRTGMRTAEALSLLTRDVNDSTGELYIRHGKGDVARTVHTDTQTMDRVCHWLDIRKPIVGASSQIVFCTLRHRDATTGKRPKKAEAPGGQIFTTYVRKMLREAALQAGLDPVKKFHPHALRHLFAGEMQREGMPIALIRDLLGHASTQTTAIYLQRCFQHEARDFMRKRPRF